jgi:hypothetical protein
LYYLTPCVPLSFKGEGEYNRKRAGALLNFILGGREEKMKWEYKIIDLGSKSGLIKEGVVRDITKRIARLGEDGWELVGLVPMYVSAGLTGYTITQALLLFKRPMKEKVDKKGAKNGV